MSDDTKRERLGEMARQNRRLKRANAQALEKLDDARRGRDAAFAALADERAARAELEERARAGRLARAEFDRVDTRTKACAEVERLEAAEVKKALEFTLVAQTREIESLELERDKALGRLEIASSAHDCTLEALVDEREQHGITRELVDALRHELEGVEAWERHGNEARQLYAAIADVEARQVRIDELKRELAIEIGRRQNFERKAAQLDRVKELVVELIPGFQGDDW